MRCSVGLIKYYDMEIADKRVDRALLSFCRLQYCAVKDCNGVV